MRSSFRPHRQTPAQRATHFRSFRGRGFTLIELLVVVAIISLLVSMLLPSLGKAREVSRGVACMANLRQINIAFHMFSDDHDGHLPNSTGRSTEPGVYINWFGGQQKGAFIPEIGLLSPYWGTAEIAACPSFHNENRPQYGPVDYAYSSYLATGPSKPLGAKFVRIKQPTDTVLIFDSARVNPFNNSGILERTPWGFEPSRGIPSFHGRHNGAGGTGWADGHAEAFIPARFATYSNYGANVALLETNNLGDIDRDGDQSTDELFDLQ